VSLSRGRRRAWPEKDRAAGPDVGILMSSVFVGLNFSAVKVALHDLPPLALGLLRLGWPAWCFLPCWPGGAPMCAWPGATCPPGRDGHPSIAINQALFLRRHAPYQRLHWLHHVCLCLGLHYPAGVLLLVSAPRYACGWVSVWPRRASRWSPVWGSVAAVPAPPGRPWKCFRERPGRGRLSLLARGILRRYWPCA